MTHNCEIFMDITYTLSEFDNNVNNTSFKTSNTLSCYFLFGRDKFKIITRFYLFIGI